MSLKNIFFKNKFTYKIYLYYNLYIRHKGYKKKASYSQWGEDHFIENFFKNKKTGIYLDVGCFHPFKYSNTCLLFNKGWKGINIDANPTSIDLFNIIRPKDINLCTTIDDKKKEYKVYFDHPFSPINTLDKELVNSRTKKPISEIEEKSTTLNKIIEKSPFEKDKINLLTVDIEGHEFQALKNFNFSKYKIDVVVLELFDKSLSKIEMFNQSIDFVTKSRIYNLLLNNNYKLINWVHSDLIFVRNDFPN